MKLEDIIANKRADFEESPRSENWQKINAQLKPKPNIWLGPKMKYFAGAAVLFCFFGLTYLFGIKKGRQASEMASMPEMAQQNSEFVAFSKNIEVKKEVFSKLVNDQPALGEVFTKDLSDLESDYQMLKSQIQVSPNKELILKAMIENLRYQEQILNVQTRILEKTESNPRVDLL